MVSPGELVFDEPDADPAARWRATKAAFLRIAEDPKATDAWLGRDAAELDEPARAVRRLLEADRVAGRFLGGAGPPPGASAEADDPSATGELAPGDRFGQCRILRLAGRGGMGEVYEAIDLGLEIGGRGGGGGRAGSTRSEPQADPDEPRPSPDASGRRVAVKILSPWWIGAGGDTALAALRREVATLARIDHPGIARVHRAGLDRPPGRVRRVAYVVLEYVAGRPLLEFVERRSGGDPAARPRLALELGRRLADAIATAHARRIVHRDLKSSNVLVRDDGSLVVVDFGIARVLRDESESTRGAGAGGDTLVTHVSAGLDAAGTVGAISPERARGGTGGPQEDVWAIGVLLFRMAAGRPPHELDGLPTFEALRQVADRPPPSIRSAAPKVPRDLATVIDRCLSFEAGDRYPDAAAVRDELDRVAAGVAPRARPVGPVGRLVRLARRHPVPAALVLVIVLGSLAATAVLARLAGVAGAQRELATQREETVRRVADELLLDVADLLEGLPGGLPARIRLLELGLAYVDEVAAPDAELSPQQALDLAEPLIRLAFEHGQRRPGPTSTRSDREALPAATAALRRAVELCRMAVEAAPEDAEVLGRAASIVRRAAWTDVLPTSELRAIDDEWLPTLIARALALDPQQPDATIARCWTVLREANDDRLSGRRLAGIDRHVALRPDLDRLVRARPDDPEVVELAAVATGAILQARLFANDVGVTRDGTPFPLLEEARAHAAAARHAAGIVPTTRAASRRWTADLLLGLALAREAPDRESEAVGHLDEATAGVEAIAAMDPADWTLRRLVSVSHRIAAVGRMALANRHAASDPARERVHLLAARDHVDRQLEVLALRVHGEELVENDASMVDDARWRRRAIDVRLAGPSDGTSTVDAAGTRDPARLWDGVPPGPR